MNRLLKGLLLLTVMLSHVGCTTDFEVYAPYEEIRVAYAVLNPDAGVQYVRVARAFQVEGDALVYAADTNLSLKGLLVTLKGDGKTWVGTEIDTLPKGPGTFNQSQTVYAFVTDGSGSGRDKLVPGKTYQLEIGTPEDSTYITAHTTIPAYPVLTGKLALTFGSGTYRCLPRVGWDTDFPISIKKAAGASGYEIKIIFNYEENGTPKQLTWDANGLIQGNRGCNDGAGNICYSLSDHTVINSFLRFMPAGNTYTYDRQDSCVLNPSLAYLYPKSVIYQVVAVDTFLGNYMYVNNPASSTDLNTSRPEYTNFTGNVQAAGVLGSYAIDSALAILNPCTEYLLGLNGTPKPSSFCE